MEFCTALLVPSADRMYCPLFGEPRPQERGIGYVGGESAKSRVPSITGVVDDLSLFFQEGLH